MRNRLGALVLSSFLVAVPFASASPGWTDGGSLVAALKYLREAGAKDIRCLTLVSAPEGVATVLETDPDVRLYTCSLDRCLDQNAYIRPGLGDAGDRIFGTF